MKYLVWLLLLISTQAHAWMGDEWTHEQKNLALVYVGTRVLDWSQTRNIAKNPNRYYEKSPFLPDHPSMGQVNRYFIVGTAASLLIADLLPSSYRRYGLYVMIGVSGLHVTRNLSLGIGISW